MAILKTKIDSGWVRGIPGWNQGVTVFRGIPYAAPPIGDLRWKAPQPVEPWEGVRDCLEFGNICYQQRRASEGGGNTVADEFFPLDWPRSEDCLYLNVWPPAKKGDEKLPVAVYFHGGGYTTGYGHLNCYDGAGFAKRDIIYVTINHRLGVFGFLADEDLANEDPHHSTGTYGIQDLIAALQWVQRNIAAFGGDPDQVTIFGQSGGGGKTLCMLLSPLAKGLYKRAIMQSGGTSDFTKHPIDMEDALNRKRILFEILGVKNVEEARKLDSETVLSAVGKMTAIIQKEHARLRDVEPAVDGYVFPKRFIDMINEGAWPDDVDIMMGCTEGEMVNLTAELPDREGALKYAAGQVGEEYAEDYLKAIHYDDDPATALEMLRLFPGLTAQIRAGHLAWCETQEALGKPDPYMYFFTLVPPGMPNAHHSAEHQYVFQTLGRSKRNYTGRDWDLSNQLAEYWSNYIKTGNPNGEGLPQWDKYTAAKPEAMIITYDLHMAPVPTNDLVELYKAIDKGEK